MFSDKIKSLLGIATSLAVLALGYASLSYVQSYAQQIQPSSFRSFAVSADGKMVAVPDVAEFSFSVITQGGNAIAQLQKDNTAKVNKAIAFVKSKDVKAADIKTQNYNLTPRYQSITCPFDGRACPPPSITGYEVSQTVLVKVRNFDAIGDLLAGVVSAGANSVSQLSFTIDDETAAQNIARTEAISKAKIKAEAIAKAGGFALGRLLAIDENGSGPVPMPYYARSSMALGMETKDLAPPTPSIEPGSQDITVNVTLRYEIQ